LVDKNNLDIAPLFCGGSKSVIDSKIDKILKKKDTTMGNIVTSSYSFVNFEEIDFVFSKLLHLHSFLDYIIKLNDIDQTRFILDGHPLPIEYEKLKKAYKSRNEIVHEFKDVKTSNSHVIALWDNLLNIIDISVTVFMSASNPDLRASLDSKYKYGIERAKRKTIYKLYSDRITSKLVEKGQLSLTEGHTIAMEGETIDDIENFKNNIQWIMAKMFKEQLVEKHGNVICMKIIYNHL
jgi:hypothetical protein